MVSSVVPLTAGFYNSKWKRPLSEEIRCEIRRKKVFGGNILEIKILPVGSSIRIKEIKLNSLLKPTLKKNRIRLLNITSLIRKNSGNMLTQKQNELKELVT